MLLLLMLLLLLSSPLSVSSSLSFCSCCFDLRNLARLHLCSAQSYQFYYKPPFTSKTMGRNCGVASLIMSVRDGSMQTGRRSSRKPKKKVETKTKAGLCSKLCYRSAVTRADHVNDCTASRETIARTTLHLVVDMISRTALRAREG
jgi:hypothetical protein